MLFLVTLILGGEKVRGERVIKVLNPATEEVVGEVWEAGREETRRAVDLALESFQIFSRLSIKDRAKVLVRASEILASRSEEVARLLTTESGKPIRDSRVEVSRVVQLFRIAAEEARIVLEGKTFRVDGYEYPPGNERRLVLSLREPLGVVGAILPFNFPANSFAHKVAPNLVVGNTVVVKPSSSTPLTALLMGEILYQAGLPKGTLSVLPGGGDSVGEELVSNRKVSGITFTGSTPVGTSIASRAVSLGKRVMAEMGGSDPIIVLEDADLDKAVQVSVRARFEYAGQNCNAGKRILVQEKVYSRFLEEYVKRVKELNVGDPLDESTEVGPVISKKAKEDMAKLVEDSRRKGGSVYSGKALETGFFFPPTVVGEAGLDMEVMKREVFGPIAPVARFSTDGEAVEMANSTEYGLQASVFTSDLKRGLRIARELRTGAVILNDSTRLRWDALPFGGVKLSGVGNREGVRNTMLAMTEEKLISMDVW